MAVSSAALGRADSAGAMEMTSVEMQMAREKLDKAKQAITKEYFDGASQMAQRAQPAEAQSRSGPCLHFVSLTPPPAIAGGPPQTSGRPP